MKRIFLYLQNHQTRIASLLLFIISVGIVAYVIPREVKFKYEFQKGKPWLYENLVAPFDFPIVKSQEELEKERADLNKNKTLFLKKREEMAESAIAGFADDFRKQWEKVQDIRAEEGEKPAVRFTDKLENALLEKGKEVLNTIYERGILQPFDREELEYGDILLTTKGISAPVQVSDYHSIASATEVVREAFRDQPEEIQ